MRWGEMEETKGICKVPGMTTRRNNYQGVRRHWQHKNRNGGLAIARIDWIRLLDMNSYCDVAEI